MNNSVCPKWELGREKNAPKSTQNVIFGEFWQKMPKKKDTGKKLLPLGGGFWAPPRQLELSLN